eukprot:1868607-Pyramimonas_sp.AAC.2
MADRMKDTNCVNWFDESLASRTHTRQRWQPQPSCEIERYQQIGIQMYHEYAAEITRCMNDNPGAFTHPIEQMAEGTLSYRR